MAIKKIVGVTGDILFQCDVCLITARNRTAVEIGHLHDNCGAYDLIKKQNSREIYYDQQPMYSIIDTYETIPKKPTKPIKPAPPPEPLPEVPESITAMMGALFT